MSQKSIISGNPNSKEGNSDEETAHADERICALKREDAAHVYHLKQDHYRRIRGGTAKLLSVHCKACGAEVLVYQQDGIDKLRRFYLNRIFDPQKYEELQHRPDVVRVKDVPNLVCPDCGKELGKPHKHKDGRLSLKPSPDCTYTTIICPGNYSD